MFMPSGSIQVIVVAIACILLLLVYPAINEVQNPRGPLGQPIPADPPRDANRIRNASGVSIVLPENWESAQYEDGYEMRIFPRWTSGRLPTVISAEPFIPPPSIAPLFQRTDFQGREAYETCVVTRESSFDDPASSCYTLSM